MTRVVLQGSPGALYRPTAADLPADNDARQSYLRYVDLHGFNLSALDLRDSDILDCNCQNVVLGAGMTQWMVSRRSDWTGATIPSDIMHNHELLSEALRQWAVGKSAAVQDRVTQLRNRIATIGYDTSFFDCIQYMINHYGWTLTQLRNNFTTILNPYPRVLEEFLVYINTNNFGANPISRQRPLAAYPVAGDGVLDLSTFSFGTDRYLAARNLETQFPDYFFYVGWIDPYPIIITARRSSVAGTPRWDWWSGAWRG